MRGRSSAGLWSVRWQRRPAEVGKARYPRLMTEDVQPADERLERLERLERMAEVLRTPVILEGQLLPPVGVAGDYMPPGSEIALTERVRRDCLPIPDTPNRENYSGQDHFRYWHSGLEDYERVRSAAASMGCTGTRLYDFGGSTGRLFRHFYCQDRRYEVWSSDFRAISHRWNQAHMPGDIRVFLNGFMPHLPVADRYFDIVSAFSVFTHIDELETAWLLELRRVLRPGGLLYLTIHDEAFWEQKPDRFVSILQGSDARLDEKTPFPAPRRAYQFRRDSYYSCNTFHSRDYVRAQWGRFFEIADIRPLDATGGQCAVWLTYDE